ncbi:MAG: hypothetical protein ACREXP_11635 [Steroidobacteraceae bacterium]
MSLSGPRNRCAVSNVSTPVEGPCVGNLDGVGWKLLGFQDQHIFEPPFGYYDRDYPGFAIEVIERK